MCRVGGLDHDPNTDPADITSRTGSMKVLDADARIFLYGKFLSEGEGARRNNLLHAPDHS